MRAKDSAAYCGTLLPLPVPSKFLYAYPRVPPMGFNTDCKNKFII